MKKVKTKTRECLPKVLIVRWEEVRTNKHGSKEFQVHSRAV